MVTHERWVYVRRVLVNDHGDEGWCLVTGGDWEVPMGTFLDSDRDMALAAARRWARQHKTVFGGIMPGTVNYQVGR